MLIGRQDCGPGYLPNSYPKDINTSSPTSLSHMSILINCSNHTLMSQYMQLLVNLQLKSNHVLSDIRTCFLHLPMN